MMQPGWPGAAAQPQTLDILVDEDGNLIVSGDVTVGGLTAGCMVFAGVAGLLDCDEVLVWDAVAKRLGIGTAVPKKTFHAAKDGVNPSVLLLENSRVNSVGSVDETARTSFGFGGKTNAVLLVADKEGDYTVLGNESSGFAIHTRKAGSTLEAMRLSADGAMDLARGGLTVSGQTTLSHPPTAPTPAGASHTVNPASATPGADLFWAGVGDVASFRVGEGGDVFTTGNATFGGWLDVATALAVGSGPAASALADGGLFCGKLGGNSFLYTEAAFAGAWSLRNAGTTVAQFFASGNNSKPLLWMGPTTDLNEFQIGALGASRWTVGTTASGIDLFLQTGATDALKIDGTTQDVTVGAGNLIVTVGNTILGGDLSHTGLKTGFYATAAIVKQTGVAVTAAGVHAALINLGLIAA